MAKHKIFCILGRSASGKSTIAKEVAKQLGLTVVKSYTTRPPRPCETADNSDHIFIASDQVDQYKSQMKAYTEINGYSYFVTKDILDSSDIYVIDPSGLMMLQKQEYDVCPIYISVDREIGLQRAIERGDDAIAWEQRYEAENGQFSLFEDWIDTGFGCHVINNNGNFKFTIEKVKEIINVEKN